MARRVDFRLSPEERVDAREALRILDGSGVSLTDAARRAVNRENAIEEVPFTEGIRRFLLDRKSRDVRPSTLRWYEDTLFAAESAIGGSLRLDQVNRPLLRRYLSSAGAQAARFRALRALFRWALKQDPPLIGVDPTEGLSFEGKRREADPVILDPSEADALMAYNSPYRTTWALLLFAGVRPSETTGDGKEPLRWGSIDVGAKLIRLPGAVAKTRRPRILEDLPGRVWQVLEVEAVGKRPCDPVCPYNYLRAITNAQRVLGYRDAGGYSLKPWGRDCTRHSFATYHLALTADPGKTALLLGHEGNPTLLYRHYRGLATKTAALAWFALD